MNTASPACDGGYLSICAIMKNEAINVIEWIAYHHAIGVDKFYLYNNNSTDATVATVAPLVAIGLVELIEWPMHPGQVQAYEDFARRHGAQWTWTAFIDLDEFINPFAFASIPAWLRTMEDHPGVAIQWQNFGPSGHETPPDGLLIEAYRTRLPDDDSVHGHVKTIVRMDSYLHSQGAHAFAVDGQVADENGDPVTIADGHYSIQKILPHDKVCLNHYYTRSRLEWSDKVSRGRADLGDDPATRRQLGWFHHYEVFATVIDERILRFADATRAMVQQLRSSTPVKARAGA